MLNQRSPRAIMAQIIKQIICIGMTLVVILPILLTVFAALKTRGDMVNTSPLLLPPLDRITLENFETVLGNKYLWIGFKNTLIILAVSLIFNVLLGTIIIGCIYNGMNFLRIDSFYQSLTKGAVIILAVLLDMAMNKKNR